MNQSVQALSVDGQVEELRIDDLRIAGRPPTRLLAAMIILAKHLHPEFHRDGERSFKSRESCILCSLAVRDFLFRAGFHSAELRPVVFIIMAQKNGTLLHSLGIGNPAGPDPRIKDRWDGHAVVVVDRWLIDTTLFQASRKQWPSLSGMVAAPMAPPHNKANPITEREMMFDMPIISGLIGHESDGTEVTLAWLDQPKNKLWKTAPDAYRKHYRAGVVDRLLGYWEEAQRG
jgi:hypothetical protein